MFRIDNATSTASIPTPAAVGPNPDSFFTEGNPSGGTPATIVTADWANAVQEEISNLIEDAGITLDKTDRTQMTAAIDTKISTNGGRLAGVVSLTTSTALTKATHSGKLLHVSSSGVTLTMPLISASAAGDCYFIKNADTTNSITLTRAGSDQFRSRSGALVNSLSVSPGEAVVITYHGSEWIILADARAEPARTDCNLILNAGNLELNRKNGIHLYVDGANRVIPASAPTLAATGLTPGTLYYIYAAWSGSAMSLEASTTVPVVDSTSGVYVKTGDATRTHVGWVVPVTGPAFSDTSTKRYVRSRYNEKDIICSNVLTSNQAKTNTTFAQISGTELYVDVLLVPDDSSVVSANANVQNDTVGANTYMTLEKTSSTTLDGGGFASSRTAGDDFQLSANYVELTTTAVIAYYAVIGRVSAGSTATWVGSATTGQRCSLMVKVTRT